MSFFTIGDNCFLAHAMVRPGGFEFVTICVHLFPYFSFSTRYSRRLIFYDFTVLFEPQF
jgi:hypothetical protein